MKLPLRKHVTRNWKTWRIKNSLAGGELINHRAFRFIVLAAMLSLLPLPNVRAQGQWGGQGQQGGQRGGQNGNQHPRTHGGGGDPAVDPGVQTASRHRRYHH